MTRTVSRIRFDWRLPSSRADQASTSSAATWGCSCNANRCRAILCETGLSSSYRGEVARGAAIDAHWSGFGFACFRDPGGILRSTARVIVVVFATVLGVFSLASPVHAEAYKTESACGSSGRVHNTTRLTAFAGHHVEISERACHNGTFMKWATNPRISFPSRPNPAAPLESVKVKQKPFIYSKKN